MHQTEWHLGHLRKLVARYSHPLDLYSLDLCGLILCGLILCGLILCGLIQ